MFVCEPCRVKQGYGLPLSGSYGPCEICGKTRTCHDIRPCHMPNKSPTKPSLKKAKP